GRGNFQPEGRDGRHLRPADRKRALRRGTPASRRSFAWTNRRRALMKISEVMTTEVQTVTPDQTAREAAGFMLRADAGSIPVCDGDTVIGMITDRDIAVRGVAEGRGPDTPVRELMTDHII